MATWRQLASKPRDKRMLTLPGWPAECRSRFIQDERELIAFRHRSRLRKLRRRKRQQLSKLLDSGTRDIEALCTKFHWATEHVTGWCSTHSFYSLYLLEAQFGMLGAGIPACIATVWQNNKRRIYEDFDITKEVTDIHGHLRLRRDGRSGFLKRKRKS